MTLSLELEAWGVGALETFPHLPLPRMLQFTKPKKSHQQPTSESGIPTNIVMGRLGIRKDFSPRFTQRSLPTDRVYPATVTGVNSRWDFLNALRDRSRDQRSHASNASIVAPELEDGITHYLSPDMADAYDPDSRTRQKNTLECPR